jgi:hypothetical protein
VTRRELALVTFVFAGLAACAKKEAPPPADTPTKTAAAAPATPNVVTVMATDFAFEAPAEIPAGLTQLKLMNHGKEIHHLQLIKFEDGKTLADFTAALKAGPGPAPTWAKEIGGPNPPVPGGESNATEILEPGDYAIVCFVDTPDHVPHIMKGMAAPLKVTGTVPPGAVLPNADVTLTLNDYSFTPSTPLSAGKHTIKVTNAATQPHEVFIVQLAPGKTMKDLMDWAKTYKGAPPATPMGGVAAIRAGGEATIDVDLPAGNYALLCFVPDAKDGKPHVEHGMAQEIKIS